MSRSRKLQLHTAQMEEIRTILNSMKNLAVMETHKLSRFLATQGQVVANIEKVARDFLDFYQFLPESEENACRVCILMGSERGFCGDFNERLIDAAKAASYSGLIAIGSRLSSRLENGLSNVITALEGANVTEEVPVILDRLIDTISSLQDSHSFSILSVLYHDHNTNQIIQRQLLPPLLLPNQETQRYGRRPVLNLEPAEFFSDLIDHYLFTALHEAFYLSMMSENQKRHQHLEGAIQHLDDEIIHLHRKSQIYRQEEITEEIEVILLNSENR